MIVYVGTPSTQEDQQSKAWATQSSTVTLEGKPRCTGNVFLLVTQWRQWLLGFPSHILFSLCDIAQVTFRCLLDQHWFTCLKPSIENSACHSYNYVPYVFRVLCVCKLVHAGASAKGVLKRAWIPWAGVPSNCELPDTGAGNQIQELWEPHIEFLEEQNVFLTADPFLQTSILKFLHISIFLK